MFEYFYPETWEGGTNQTNHKPFFFATSEHSFSVFMMFHVELFWGCKSVEPTLRNDVGSVESEWWRLQ